MTNPEKPRKTLIVSDDIDLATLIKLAWLSEGDDDIQITTASQQSLAMIEREPPDLLVFHWLSLNPAEQETYQGIQALLSDANYQILILCSENMSIKRSGPPDADRDCLIIPCNLDELIATRQMLLSGQKDYSVISQIERKKCHDNNHKENIIVRTIDAVGLLDLLGGNIDYIPVWQRCDEEKYRLDIITYGLHLLLDNHAEWCQPKGIIKDAAGTPNLTWFPGHSKNEPSECQPFQSDEKWWEARSTVIGACERIGKLFQRSPEDLFDRDKALLRLLSMDYKTFLPDALFEQCRELYPEYFDWLASRLQESD